MKPALPVAMLLAFSAANTWACSCGRQSVDDAKQSADIVFAGRVEEVTLVDPRDTWEPRIVVRFSVARVWKGPVERNFTMHSSFESSSCAGFFRELLEPGTTLLVYGDAMPGKVWKANGQGGAENASSYTLRREQRAPVRKDLLDAVADDAPVYTTSICTRTRPIIDAAEDLDALGKAREIAALEQSPGREALPKKAK